MRGLTRSGSPEFRNSSCPRNRRTGVMFITSMSSACRTATGFSGEWPIAASPAEFIIQFRCTFRRRTDFWGTRRDLFRSLNGAPTNFYRCRCIPS